MRLLLIAALLLTMVSAAHGGLPTPDLRLIPKPPNGAGHSSALQSIETDASQATLRLVEDSQLLTPQVAGKFLQHLADIAGASDSATWRAAIAYKHLLVRYLQYAKLDSVLAVLRHAAADATWPPLPQLLEQIRKAAGKLDPAAFVAWADAGVSPKGAAGVATSLQAVGRAAEAPAAAAAPTTAAAAATAPKRPSSTGRRADPKPGDLNDPLNQLVDWSKRMKTLGGRLNFLSQEAVKVPRPRDTNPNRNVGNKKFKLRKIGVVFHVMQFRDKKGYLYPPQAYWHGAQPARRMVDLSNELFLFSGTNIQFVLKEYRVNTTKYPYLRYKNVVEYQACAAQQERCTCVLAAKHNVDSSRYINIFVVGSFAYYGLVSGNSFWSDPLPSAYSSALPGFFDACNGVTFSDPKAKPGSTAWTTQSLKYQHIWLNFDRLDPLIDNSAASSNAGPAALAHELGHLLGLLHTFNGNTCHGNGDGVQDTPTEDGTAASSFIYSLASVCANISKGRLPKRAEVSFMDSCDGDKYRYIDDLWNIMSYSPAQCRLYFTRGQVRRMQASVGKYTPRYGR